MDFNDPKELNDPQLFDDMDFDNPNVYGDTSITDGLVLDGLHDFDFCKICKLPHS